MEEISCSICLIGFEIDENDIDSKPHRLPCSHIFHKPCLEDWFKKQSSCPNCRTVFNEKNKGDIIKHDHTITLLLNAIKDLQIKSTTTTTTTNSPTTSTTEIKPSDETIVPKPIIPTTTTTTVATPEVTTTSSPSVTITQKPIYQELEKQQQQQQQQQYYNTTPIVTERNYNRSDDYLLAGLIKDPYLQTQSQPQQPTQPTHHYNTYQPIYSPSYELPRVNNNGSIDTSKSINSSIKKYMYSNSSPIVASDNNNSNNYNNTRSLTPHQHLLMKTKPPLRNWRCNNCFKDGLGYSEMFQCNDGCINFALCRYCVKQTNSITSPEIQELVSNEISSHPHQLYSMNISDIYNQGANCDICRASINLYAYHCTTCKDFDVCYNCLKPSTTTNTTHYPNVTISSSSSPSTSSVYERTEPQTADFLPDRVKTRYHSGTLIKLQTPLSVYNSEHWNCDVCKKSHNEIWETFYHEEDGTFDLCISCYHKR